MNAAGKESQKKKLKVVKQCYVEEQTKMRDSFIVESFKILKSLLKNLKIFLAYLVI
jgi:hypothetical protein